MSSKISDVFGGAAAIAKGMSVTFMEMLNPTITEDYPDAPAKFQERYRGVHELQRDENGLEKCVACFLCAAAELFFHAFVGLGEKPVDGGHHADNLFLGYFHATSDAFVRIVVCGGRGDQIFFPQ